MSVSGPRDSKEAFAPRGQEIYDCDIRPHREAGDAGKFVAVDFATGAYEIDSDDFRATERLRLCYLHAQIWLLRVRQRAPYRALAVE